MTTDHPAEKQKRIEQRMRTRTAEYPALWQRMMDEWLCPEPTDRAWLLYSANYLFRTAGIRWALDPLTLSRRVPSAPEMDVSPLQALNYIVLSHRHHDHFDPPLLEKLACFPARWVMPPFMVETVTALGVPPGKIIPLPPDESLRLGGISLTAFEGLHWEESPEAPSGRRGVHAAGYLVEFNDRRWLFPGDVRTYDPNSLPIKDALHGLVAHVWLGRGQALAQSAPLRMHSAASASTCSLGRWC
jgi:L-ascorbate metabolism protein UlaG (beta-lactamase superfamily)